jgi:hypothetical protein
MKYKEVNWLAWDCSPTEEVFNDWLKTRKAHRAPVSQTVINRMAMHINKLYQAGISPDDALGVAIENGWRGIKYSWVIKAIQQDMDSISDFTNTRDIPLEVSLTDRSWAE